MRKLILLLPFLLLVFVPLSKGGQDEHKTFLPITAKQVCPGDFNETPFDAHLWHPLHLDVAGPMTHEAAESPNPWLDIRVTVRFHSPNGETFLVPGYYAGDGQGGSVGNTWRVSFSPNQVGEWKYCAFIREMTQINVSSDMNIGIPFPGNGDGGAFTVAQNSSAEGLLKQGRPQYNGTHYLVFNDGAGWLKGGTDSPENFFGYAGFDNTFDQGGILENFVHRYPDHVQDWQEGDPYFVSTDTGYDSKGIIGAINYLSSVGVNSIYWLPMNLGGDGQETYPFISPAGGRAANTHYDVSKLRQWLQVAEHAQRKGVAMNIVLGETEQGNATWLDGGGLGVERKLFYKTMQSIFGHLMIVTWNISEESNFNADLTREFAGYLQENNWANHPVTFHTHHNDTQRYREHLGETWMDVTSIQYSPDNAGLFVEMWRALSTQAGHPWVVYLDEQGPWNVGLTSTNWDQLRREILWPALLSGGAGVEWYAGYHGLPLGGDMNLENFRTREAAWLGTTYARNFMQQTPFWDMIPGDHLISGESQVLYKEGQWYLAYLPLGNDENLSLPDGRYTVSWFNTRTGLYHSVQSTQVIGGTLNLDPPDNNDWAVMIQKE